MAIWRNSNPKYSPKSLDMYTLRLNRRESYAAACSLTISEIYCARPQFEVFVLFFLGQRGL
jgi:hypothetical protein